MLAAAGPRTTAEQKPSVEGLAVEGSHRVLVGLSVTWENRDAYYIALTQHNIQCECGSVPGGHGRYSLRTDSSLRPVVTGEDAFGHPSWCELLINRIDASHHPIAGPTPSIISIHAASVYRME